MTVMSQLEAEFAFQLKVHKVKLPVREHVFHPLRKWRFDFAWPSEMVAVEVEGMPFSRPGRHQTKDGFTKDCEKYNEAAIMGWVVIRVTAEHIDDMRALQWVQQALLRGGD